MAARPAPAAPPVEEPPAPAAPPPPLEEPTAPVPFALPADRQAPGQRRLAVVERRRTLQRWHRRQVIVLRALGIGLVAASLALAAIGHAVVASDQRRIDALQTQLSTSLAKVQDLQLARAELESPSRVVSVAQGTSPFAVTAGARHLPLVDFRRSASTASRSRGTSVERTKHRSRSNAPHKK
jgi:hypothetical protein